MDGAIRGTLSVSEATIRGTLSISSSYDKYEGSYTVVPSEFEQTLNTKYRIMSNDVTVRSIPTYRVANAAGGDTFTIGELNE